MNGKEKKGIWKNDSYCAAGITDGLILELITNDTEYEIKNSGSAKFNKTIIIPSSYNGKPITVIGDYAFRGCSDLTEISIPESVKRIEAFAFANSGLTV